MKKPFGFKDRIKSTKAPKAFQEPQDRPFASLDNMDAEAFAKAFLRDGEDKK